MPGATVWKFGRSLDSLPFREGPGVGLDSEANVDGVVAKYVSAHSAAQASRSREIGMDLVYHRPWWNNGNGGLDHAACSTDEDRRGNGSCGLRRLAGCSP